MPGQEPRRRHGPDPALGYRWVHSWQRPFPEFPAFDHVNEAHCEPGHILAPHRHPTLEVCCFHGGRATWSVAGREHQLHAGDIFLAWPGEMHGGRPDPADPNRNFAVGIDPARLVLAPGAGADLGRAIEQLASDDGRRVFGGGEDAVPVLRRLLAETDRLIDADPTRRALTLIMCQALLVEFLVVVARGLLAEDRPRHRDGRIDDLEGWLAGRIADPPSVAEMAAQVGLSPTQLGVVCRRARGTTPLELLTRLRIAEAQRRLADPQALVTEVALDLGFSSSQYFAVVFKRATGETPQGWQKANAR